jgi:Uma2 family endonuclease
MTPATELPEPVTMAELLKQLGGISPHRVRLRPAPGKATERDLLALHNRTGRLYELVQGVLVEKIMGYPESLLALWLGHLVQTFLDHQDLGILAGADGAMRLMPGLVRIPDISFVSWDRLPGREIPTEPIAGLAPDLAVEVLSGSNTKEEMERKLGEYFLAGVRLVWFVHPVKRTVQVFTSPETSVVLTEDYTLDGGEVLPGLALRLKQIFARTPRPKEKMTKGRARPRPQAKRKSKKGGDAS